MLRPFKCFVKIADLQQSKKIMKHQLSLTNIIKTSADTLPLGSDNVVVCWMVVDEEKEEDEVVAVRN